MLALKQVEWDTLTDKCEVKLKESKTVLCVEAFLLCICQKGMVMMNLARGVVPNYEVLIIKN